MKIALIADLHANREAVEAVLDHALGQGIGDWALLGDYVGYGAEPGWVVDRVRELVRGGAIAVQGNHDHAVVRGISTGMRGDAARMVRWTRARLTVAQLDFLASMPLQHRRGDQLYVHANAWAPAAWDYVLGVDDAVRSLQAGGGCRYNFCGHVHQQRLYHLADNGKAGEFTPAPEVPIPVPPHRRWLVIGGSAGQPRDGNPAACYAVFDDAAALLTFHRVPYDHQAAGDKIRAADLPQRLATRLDDGL